MVIVAASHSLGVLGVAGSRTVEDLRMPVVLPAGASPEQTLIPDLKHHAIK